MTREDIKGSYSRLLITGIYQRISEAGGLCDFARQYINDTDAQVARNALCALTKATDAELAQLHPMINELIDIALNTKNSSVLRPLLGIIERQDITKADLRTDFLDYCLDKMTSPDEAPSIQALCMKLAHKMCKLYPELSEELILRLQTMELPHYTPAVKSVRRRILRNKQ